jgi:hypothetical protein
MSEREREALEAVQSLLTNHPTDIHSVDRAREIVGEVLRGERR